MNEKTLDATSLSQFATGTYHTGTEKQKLITLLRQIANAADSALYYSGQHGTANDLRQSIDEIRKMATL